MRHSLPVIDDADQALPAALDGDFHAIRARIQGVLKQLLHHRRGPLHHLAGGDFVGNGFGEDANDGHGNLFIESLSHRVIESLSY